MLNRLFYFCNILIFSIDVIYSGVVVETFTLFYSTATLHVLVAQKRKNLPLTCKFHERSKK